MTMTEMQQNILRWAKSKGWMDRDVSVPEQVALVHSELSEALESWRENQPISWIDENGKPQGLASEYADAVIRLFHYASLNYFDLGAEVEKKMVYNETRDYRHGGKRA